MKIRSLLALTLTAVATVGPCAASAAGESLSTKYTLLVGHPDPHGGAVGTVLLVPGTLIPSMEGPGELAEKLEEAYRLERVVVETQYMRRAAEGERVEIPAEDLGLDVSATLVGFNESVATYQVQVHHAGELLADTPVSVKRGARAIVGSRDGEAAPYLFIVIYPEGLDVQPAEKANKPKVLERVNPKYPPLARKNGISGTVLLNVLVDRTGACRVVEVLESPDPLLSDAARDAVELWRFEPGLDEAGNPTDSEITLTIAFQLR
jgi:TonB family protein